MSIGIAGGLEAAFLGEQCVHKESQLSQVTRTEEPRALGWVCTRNLPREESHAMSRKARGDGSIADLLNWGSLVGKNHGGNARHVSDFSGVRLGNYGITVAGWLAPRP